MANVSVDYQLAENERIWINVEADDDRPDVLDDIKARARSLFRETLEDVYAVTVDRRT